MKNVLIIKPHSFVDLITNSSSELFVCETEKSLEAVLSIAEELYENCKRDDYSGCYGFYMALEKSFVVPVDHEEYLLKDEYEQDNDGFYYRKYDTDRLEKDCRKSGMHRDDADQFISMLPSEDDDPKIPKGAVVLRFERNYCPWSFTGDLSAALNARFHLL